MPSIVTNVSGKPVTLPLNPAALLAPGGKVIYASVEPDDIVAALGGGHIVARMGLTVSFIDSDKATADEGTCVAVYAADSDLQAVRATADAALPKVWRFHNVLPLPAASAQAGIDLLSDEEASGVMLEGFALAVDGATPWSGAFTKLIIEDTNSVPVAEIAKAALAANAVIPLHSADVTLLKAFVVGCTLFKGLRIKADAAVAAGSDLQVAYWGQNVALL